MKTKDFDYYLPEELIAQTPLTQRDHSRLMCLDKETGALSHHHFYELPEFLRPGDCLILNNSRVLPRVRGTAAHRPRREDLGMHRAPGQAPAQGRKNAVWRR